MESIKFGDLYLGMSTVFFVWYENSL